jgi:hypothetical protein
MKPAALFKLGFMILNQMVGLSNESCKVCFFFIDKHVALN